MSTRSNTFALCAVLSIFSVSSLLAQASEKLPQKAYKKILFDIYREQALETFEAGSLDRFSLSGYRKANSEIAINKQFHAPLSDSNACLSWRVTHPGNEKVELSFNPPLTYRDFGKYIYIWVYGTQAPGKLYVYIRDTYNRLHQLELGRVNYRGWKKLKVGLPSHVQQKDFYLAERRNVKVERLMYLPGPISREKKRQILFIDELGAKLRPRYELPSPR